jgi:ubiquinone/menaquinone biosynthesis C-methylase UbiE
MNAAAILLLSATLTVCAASAQTPPSHQHDFAGADQWARIFDDPARDAWQQPHRVIETLHLAPDAVVADIGAGTGYFAMRIAGMNPGGHVYAEDIEPDMIRYLSERAKREGLANVTPLLGGAQDAMLPKEVDLALVVDTYHHIGDREAYFRRLAGRLKQGGEVAIIDFRRDSPVGPPTAERIAPDEVKKEMGQAGYQLAAQHTFLPNQYFLIFRRKSP